MLKAPLTTILGGIERPINELPIKRLVEIEHLLNSTAAGGRVIGSELALGVLKIAFAEDWPDLDVATVKTNLKELTDATTKVLEFTGFKEAASGESKGAAPAGE